MSNLLVTGSSYANPAVNKVNESYKSKILGIFQQKCFHCHSTEKNTWYQDRLLFKGFFQEKVELAVSGYEMTDSLPLEDLKDSLKMIKTEVENETMPPWINFFITPFNGLNTDEKQLIINWATESLELIKDS